MVKRHGCTFYALLHGLGQPLVGARQLRKGKGRYTAINMRTSVKMIEMDYSDVVPDNVAKQLEGSWG